jgi:hypothetical protein
MFKMIDGVAADQSFDKSIRFRPDKVKRKANEENSGVVSWH